MKCLIDTSWEKDKELLIDENSHEWDIRSVDLEYNAGPPCRYWIIDFDSIEDICKFLGDYDGYKMFHQDGREMVNHKLCGVKEWPIELQMPFFGLYLDYMGW